VAEKNRQLWVDDVLSKEGVSRARRFGWIDTYTFTKALGEQLLLQSNDGVPTIILRPSVIESSLYHPEPGWIEGYRMTSPILFGYGKGTLPDFPARPDGVIDIIPIDFVVSALLASLTIPECGNPSVFQVASGCDNPLRWKELMEYTDAYFHAMPLHTPSGPIVPRAWKYRGSDEFNAWLQRHRRMVDFALKACNSVDFWPGALRLARKLKRKQRFFRRMEDMTRVYGDYTQLVCCFDTKNTRRLFQSLPRGDQQKFFFDPSIINWPTYIREVQLPGVRRHVIRDAAQQRRGLARVVLQPQLNDRMPGTLETKEFG
jgi:hypothetical protein